MSAEVPPTTDPNDQRIDKRLWDIMQDVCYHARLLKTEHEKAHKQLKRIDKPKTQEDRDSNAERDMLKATGGAPWMQLAHALDKLTAHGKIHESIHEGGGQVSVSANELMQRMFVKAHLGVLVTSMYAHAEKSDLMRTGTIRKGQSAAAAYHGKLMGRPLGAAFAALAEWDGYMAEQLTAQYLQRLRSPDFKPASPNNTLALPAPSVPSQHPATPPGLN